MAGSNYDLCKAAFESLQHDERSKFVIIMKVGDKPLPYNELAMRKGAGATAPPPSPARTPPQRTYRRQVYAGDGESSSDDGYVDTGFSPRRVHHSSREPSPRPRQNRGSYYDSSPTHYDSSPRPVLTQKSSYRPLQLRLRPAPPRF